MVVEIEDPAVVVECGGRTEIQLAGAAVGRRRLAMFPGAEHEVRARCVRAARQSQAIEIGGRAFHAVGVVVPAAEVQDSSGNSRVTAVELRPVPPGVLWRM